MIHFPMTGLEFDSAAPRSMLHASIGEADLAPLAAWRGRAGTAFGETPGPRIGAYFSIATDPVTTSTVGFQVVKLLRGQFRGVHLRMYSSVFPERPTAIDEAGLESRPPDLALVAAGRPSPEPFAIGHIPLSHRAFVELQPEFIQMALVDPDELLGFEEWRLAKGGFF